MLGTCKHCGGTSFWWSEITNAGLGYASVELGGGNGGGSEITSGGGNAGIFKRSELHYGGLILAHHNFILAQETGGHKLINLHKLVARTFTELNRNKPRRCQNFIMEQPSQPQF